MTVRISVCCTSATAAWIGAARSCSTLISMAPGSSARNTGIKALTWFTTSTVLASGCRNTATVMAREPLYQFQELRTWTLSMTRATSPSRTGAPLR